MKKDNPKPNKVFWTIVVVVFICLLGGFISLQMVGTSEIDSSKSGCTPSLNCTEWTPCILGKINRNCTDTNYCQPINSETLACSDYKIQVVEEYDEELKLALISVEGDWTVAITYPTEAYELSDEYGLITKEASGKYLIFKAVITNYQKEPDYFTYDFILETNDGYTYERDTSAELYASILTGNEIEPFYSFEKLQPKLNRVVSLTFDVPEDFAGRLKIVKVGLTSSTAIATVIW